MAEPTKLASTTLVQRNTDITFIQLDNELFAIDAPKDVGYSLNESASKIWEMIGMPISVGEICVRLRQEYNVDEQTCLREVSTILQSLHDAGLVELKNVAGL